MRHRIKYLLTFLTSVAVTFHFFLSRTLHANRRERSAEAVAEHDGKQSEDGADESLLFTLRPASKPPYSRSTGWRVLPGNITVHVGIQRNHEKPNYLLAAETLCSDYDETRLKLLVFVASKVSNSAQRQAIRDTWAVRALQEALNFRVVFILGRSDQESGQQSTVVDEDLRYGDIIQTDDPETFRNLARKTFAGLLWSQRQCPRADFVMKTDDDILIHVPNLLSALKEAKHPEDLLLCHENRMRKILRKDLLEKVPENYGKYEVPGWELPGLYYPPYCSGMAYVFSSQVRDRLLKASMVTPLFFIEDVYLTGFCRYKAGVRITSHPGITLRPPMTPEQAVCSFRLGRITSQEVGVDELRRMWAERNTRGFFCPEFVGYALGRTNIRAENAAYNIDSPRRPTSR